MLIQLARPKRFELLTPQIRSLVTPITHPIVRAPMAARVLFAARASWFGD